MDEPTWSLILDAARELGADGAEFSRAALLDAVIRRDPSRQPKSIGPVIQGMTRNASGGPPSPCGTPLVRVTHGRYRLAGAPSTARQTPVAVAEPAQSTPPTARHAPASADLDLVLVGCVKTKADDAQAARDLYRSPLFERRRRYAERHGARWYILSAEHGLVPPETLVEPYDTALAEQSQEYRRAWGQWVVAKLSKIEGDLRGQVIEIHAGDAYVAPLRQPLAAKGATIRHPLSALGLGAQLSWYDRAAASNGEAAASLADADTLPTSNPSSRRRRSPT